MKKVFYSLFACFLIFYGCNSGGGDAKKVLSQFFEALHNKDITTARKYATADSKSMLDMMDMGMKMAKDSGKDDKFSPADMQYGEVKIEGDKATVPVKNTKDGETTNFSLKKEKGEWKVAFDKASMMTMGMEKMKEKGINPLDSVSKGLNELNKMDKDSLREGINEAMKTLDSAKQK